MHTCLEGAEILVKNGCANVNSLTRSGAYMLIVVWHEAFEITTLRGAP